MNLPATIFESPTVHRVGWALLHSVWQGVAVLALLWLALILLRKSRAQTRYLAGLAAMVGVVALPIATFVLSTAPVSSSNPIAVRLPSPGVALPTIPAAMGTTSSIRPTPVAAERIVPLEQDRIGAGGDIHGVRTLRATARRTSSVSLAESDIVS